MKLDWILLGTLMRHPATGYDLKKFLDGHGRFLRSNTTMSQVYRVLSSMEDRGWVEHTVEQRAGAQDAKTYAVTEEGEVVFMDWLTSPFTPPSRFLDPDLDVRLAFAPFMTPEQIVSLIDTELEVREKEKARYRHRDRTLSWSERRPVSPELVSLIDTWAHETGSQGMDAHLDRLRLLRKQVLGLAGHFDTAPSPAREPAED